MSFFSEGEPLIYFKKISSLPADARKVLQIRHQVAEIIRAQGGMRSPFEDLEIEQKEPTLMELNSQIVHPVTFILPTPILRLISSIS